MWHAPSATGPSSSRATNYVPPDSVRWEQLVESPAARSGSTTDRRVDVETDALGHGDGLLVGAPAQLDRGTAVHHDLQTGVTCPLGGLLVDHTQLQPHRFGADRDRFVDVAAGDL